MGDERNHILPQRGEPSRDHIDVDMFPFLRRQGGSDETDPEDQVPHQAIPPIEARGKKVSKDNLDKGDEDDKR